MKKRQLVAHSIMNNDAQLEILSKAQQKKFRGGTCYTTYCTCPSGSWMAQMCDGDIQVIIDTCGGKQPWDDDYSFNCVNW